MSKPIPAGNKELKKGKTVYVGSRKYSGSCPEEIHPDKLKKPVKPKEQGPSGN